MKSRNIITIGCWLATSSAAAQLKTGVPLQRVLPDTAFYKQSLKPVTGTFDSAKQKAANATTNALRLPPVPAAEARYNAQYKAYQQHKLSGSRNPLAPATYVPPPEEKPNILLRKKPKPAPKTFF